MNTYYANEKQTLLLISLLKAHGIRKVVASPGVTNISFVASVQHDGFFELYSCVDERSAAYLACGMSAQSNEPVVLSCTGATASRNYMPGLTEAYYRKLPILAVTSSQDISRIGMNSPQCIDRRVLPNDIARYSLNLPQIKTKKEEKDYAVLINKAILELTHRGGGPVHINLTASYNRDFSIKELPSVRKITRYTYGDQLPAIRKCKIAVIVGEHKVWSEDETNALEQFCKTNNAVVLVDHISKYNGGYAVHPNLLLAQRNYHPDCCDIDLLIHIGEIHGMDFDNIRVKETWRVNPDGEVKNTFGHLENVFEMREVDFFKHYSVDPCGYDDSGYAREWQREVSAIRAQIDQLPFSNIWVGSRVLPSLPENCVIHFGIQSSLRSWNFFETEKSYTGFCNTGGFGIDGNMSSLIGASLADPDQLFFGVFGDLSFFYDMNSLGNRHCKDNLRIILINNGIAQQFKNPDSAGEQFGENADPYIAAAGHFGNRSRFLVKHYAEDLGFHYISASDKNEFEQKLPVFCSSERIGKPVLFEVFTDTKEESSALRIIKTLAGKEQVDMEGTVKTAIKRVIGKRGQAIVKALQNNEE